MDKNNIQILSKNRFKALQRLDNKKFRQHQEFAWVEGKRLLDQLTSNNIELAELFCTEDNLNELLYLNPDKITLCQQWQLQKLSNTKNSQNAAALVKATRKAFEKKDFILYLDGIKEPGNMGTIFRTALALGIDGIITSPQCCDIFNPKVIRASLGAVFSCPSQIQDQHWLIQQKCTVAAAHLTNALDISSSIPVDFPLILVIGSEAHGVHKAILSRADVSLKIPITSNMESLNAAVAAAILIYDIKYHSHHK